METQSQTIILSNVREIEVFCAALARASNSGAAVDLGLVAKDAGIAPRNDDERDERCAA